MSATPPPNFIGQSRIKRPTPIVPSFLLTQAPEPPGQCDEAVRATSAPSISLVSAAGAWTSTSLSGSASSSSLSPPACPPSPPPRLRVATGSASAAAIVIGSRTNGRSPIEPLGIETTPPPSPVTGSSVRDKSGRGLTPALSSPSVSRTLATGGDLVDKKRSFAERVKKRLSLSSGIESRDDSALDSKRLSEAKSAPDEGKELLELLARLPLVVLEGPNQLYLSTDADSRQISYDFCYCPGGWKLMNELWRFFWIDTNVSRSLKPFAAGGRLCIIQSALTKQFLTMRNGEPRFTDIPFSQDSRSENSQAIIELFNTPGSLLETGLCLFEPSSFRQQDQPAEVLVVFSPQQVPVGRHFLTVDLTPVYRPTATTLQLGGTEIAVAPSASATRGSAIQLPVQQSAVGQSSSPAVATPTSGRALRLRTEKKVRADSGKITTKLAIGLAEIFSIEMHAGHPSVRNVLCNTLLGLSDGWQESSTSDGASFQPALVATGPIANHSSNYFTPCMKVSLRACNLRYVCAHPLGNKLLCNRKKAATWENFLVRFDLQLSCAFFWTSLERYWTCNMSNGRLSCSDKLPTPKTRFHIDWKAPGRIAILAPNGMYVRARGSDLVADRPSAHDAACIFHIEFFGDEDLVSDASSVAHGLQASSSRDSMSELGACRAEEEEAAEEKAQNKLSKKQFRVTIRAEINEISRMMGRLRREESLSLLTPSPASSSSVVAAAAASPSKTRAPAGTPTSSLLLASVPSTPAPTAPVAPDLPELFGKERVMYAIPEVAHLFKDFLSVGWLLMTEFRVVYVPPHPPASGPARSWELPLGCIERVVQSGKVKDSEEGFYGFEFQLYNLRSIRLCATPHTFRLISFATLRTALDECVRPVRPEFSYTLRAGPLFPLCENVESIPSLEDDLRRQGIPNADVRLCTANADFELCKSYPKVIAVPAQLTDDDMADIAQFRSKGRVPAIVWTNQHLGSVLVRCSQPRSGLRNARCEPDERFVFFARAASHKPSTIQLLDARPHLNAVANHLKGGGGENLSSGYPNCTRKYLNIGNIHKMRHCLERLRVHCEGGLVADDASPDSSSSADVAWLVNIRLILAGAVFAAEQIANGVSCIVHCSDGWDRTPQITALAQLVLDPYYRTVLGLQVLIEKEWCAFGHQFSSRMAAETRKITDSNRSPIFLQWIDCVYQLTVLFPRAFEFNAAYLKDILHHVFSGRFGTFLFDSLRERIAHQVFTKTDSLWAMLNRVRTAEPTKYINPKFEPSPEPLLGIDLSQSDSVRLWADLYLDESFPYATSVVPRST